MKNLKKNVSTVWAFAIIVVLAIAVGAYAYTASKKGWEILNVTENLKMLNDVPDNQPELPVRNPETPVTSGMRVIEEENYSLSYSSALATEVNVVEELPDNRTAQFSARTLIGNDRYATLGEPNCYYGQSGEPSDCRAERENRVSFFVANKSVDELTDSYDTVLLTATSVAGRKSVLYRIGAEGEGVDVYFVPIDENRTFVVKRFYNSTGFPTKAQFDQILATVKITE